MIRWITPEIGTAAFENAIEEIPIQENGTELVDVRNLVDKEGNQIDDVKAKIYQGLELINQGKRAVVCCDYGMSRSNALAAGILSLHTGVSLEDAVRKVLKATGETNIRVEVLQTVRQAISSGSRVVERPPEQKRILITGGSGFIGSGLASDLREKSFDVYTPSRNAIDLTGGMVNLDLYVRENGIHTLVHLANPRVYTTNDSVGATLTMLKNVLDVCFFNNLRLFYISSWVVCSGYRGTLIADEQLPLKPKGTYGQCKALCEHLIQFYREKGLDRCTVLRVGNVYGVNSRAPRFIWNFKAKAKNNEMIVTHEYLNGFPSLDLLHISDLRRAIVLAVEKNRNGDFNIGTGQLLSTAWVAEYIVKALKSKSKIMHHKIQDYVGNVSMDSTKAKKQLDWQPKIHFSEGITEILKN